MFGFWFWFALTYLAIGVAFILLMIGSHKAEQEMRREQCMMKHPAGSQRMTEHSPTGPIHPTSLSRSYAMNEEEWFRERREGVDRIARGELPLL